MTLLPLFLAHEFVTQRRSGRFRALAFLYVVLAALPAVLLFAAATRAKTLIGSAAYAEVVGAVQPILTVLFVAAISIDAIARERDEGSFAVLGVAPLSSAGYLIRRWIAVVMVCLPLTALPPLIAAALAAQAQHRAPLVSAFAATWLLDVVPPLLVASALALALGTITGRTVVAIIVAAILLTFGLDMINNVLAYRHHHFDGPGELFGMRPRQWQDLLWSLKGYWAPALPTEAAHPLAAHARNALPRAAGGVGLAALFLGAAAHYLRRTRRDLRPWRIPDDHRFRSFLRIFNAVREEYSPDAGASRADWLALAAGIAVAAASVVMLLRDEAAFADLARQRSASESSAPATTATAIVPLSMRIDATVETNGRVAAHASLAVRNDGARPESHLAFAMNPGVTLTRMRAGAGRLRVQRLWQRIDVELDPPLAPGETRTLDADTAGTPSSIDFALPGRGAFGGRWHRYERARESIEMSDLSRSTIDAAVSEVRMQLDADDLAPVLRYTPWRESAEIISPPVALDVRIRHPFAFAAEACGGLAGHEPLIGRCTTPLAGYRIFGAPLRQTSLAANATLAYIAAHETLAPIHGPGLASSIAIARTWPGLALPPRIVFIEQPAEPGEHRYWGDWNATNIAARGSLVFVPEAMFRSFTPMSSGAIAAALVSRTLAAQRRVVPEQAGFFTAFYDLVAARRLGGRKGNAVVPGIGNGVAPDVEPIASMRPRWWTPDVTRLGRVLAEIEHRAGSDHVVEGIDDFVAAGPAPGTAKELVDAIARRAGIDLGRVYSDYFAGRALPQLTLANVAFRRAGAAWEVTGELRNDGSGEALAPLVLRSARGSQWRTLRVDGGQRVAFAFASESEPRSVQLDPDRVCYRYAPIGTVDSVENRGER